MADQVLWLSDGTRQLPIKCVDNGDGTYSIAASAAVVVEPAVGAATEAKQDAAITALESIDAAVADVATQTTLALIQAKTDNIPAQGQALAGDSLPVVLTAAQAALLTPPAAISGFATAALQTALNALLDGSGITTLTATIANGASLSGAVALAGKALFRINMPSTWTAANLTFQTSPDGVTYYNLYTATGTEYTVTAAVDRSIIIPPADLPGTGWLKVRSGTSAAAVNQGGARDIILVVRAI